MDAAAGRARDKVGSPANTNMSWNPATAAAGGGGGGVVGWMVGGCVRRLDNFCLFACAA
jgi:hypothetical protein